MTSEKLAHINADNPPAYPAGVEWDADIPAMTLNQMVDEAIAEYGDKSALDFMGKKVSFNELNELIDRAAKGFQDLGVKKGDRVGVFMPNSTYHFIMFFGALKAGAVLVPFLSTYSEEEIQQQIEDSGAKTMVTLSLKSEKKNPKGEWEVTEFYPKLENLMKRGDLPEDFKVVNCGLPEILPTKERFLYKLLNKVIRPFVDITQDIPTPGTQKLNLKQKIVKKVRENQITPVDPTVRASVVGYKDFMSNNGKPASVDVQPEDLALLQYTNGTTSAPKGVMLTHGNIASNVLQTEEYMVDTDGTNPDMIEKGKEKILGILPYFHVYGMNVLMMFSMREGAEVLILPNPRDLPTITDTIKKEKPSVIPFVPAHFQAVLEKISPEDREYFKTPKFYMSGGAKLEVSLREEFQNVTGCQILQGYGLSETSPVLAAETVAKESPPNSVGFVIPGVEVQIRDSATEQTVKVSEEGEIWTTGPNVMQGYWQRPEENKKSLKDAWFKTGDIGKIDDEGRLYITGRSGDFSKINGEKVGWEIADSYIIENVPGVLECTTVGVEDPRSGEALVSFVRFNPNQTPKDNGESLKQQLQDKDVQRLYVPKYVVYWPENEELPKVGVGKPDKKTLKKLAAEKFGPKPDNTSTPTPNP